MSSYKHTLEYFPKPGHISELLDEDIPGVLDVSKYSDNDVTIDNPKFSTVTMSPTITSTSSSSNLSPVPVSSAAGLSIPTYPVPPPALCCACCGVTVQAELQKFLEMQEAVLKTEFRCKQCRTCGDCRKGAGHEEVSMKQEAEQELIRESIIVKEDGYAIAKLPFILNPEENLQNNRHVALGMLNSVLKKYCRNPEERKAFQEALKKMMDKKHLMFLTDLTPEQRSMLDNAKVSYWIPWNIQYKDSFSTPIRIVFNASSATSSGLSLNDCLAKSVPDLVQLLSVMLEWQMGPSAFCGDISQFYPTILLTEEHWQYQRVLVRENLDPASGSCSSKAWIWSS